MLIYKVFRSNEHAAYEAQGQTDGAPVDLADGYIHFSTAGTVAETLAKHFAGETGLVMVACETEAMGGQLRWEVSRGGALFPHLYRRLMWSDAVWARPIGWDGRRHILPEGVA